MESPFWWESFVPTLVIAGLIQFVSFGLVMSMSERDITYVTTRFDGCLLALLAPNRFVITRLIYHLVNLFVNLAMFVFLVPIPLWMMGALLYGVWRTVRSFK